MNKKVIFSLISLFFLDMHCARRYSPELSKKALEEKKSILCAKREKAQADLDDFNKNPWAGGGVKNDVYINLVCSIQDINEKIAKVERNLREIEGREETARQAQVETRTRRPEQPIFASGPQPSTQPRFVVPPKAVGQNPYAVFVPAPVQQLEPTAQILQVPLTPSAHQSRDSRPRVRTDEFHEEHIPLTSQAKDVIARMQRLSTGEPAVAPRLQAPVLPSAHRAALAPQVPVTNPSYPRHLNPFDDDFSSEEDNGFTEDAV